MPRHVLYEPTPDEQQRLYEVTLTLHVEAPTDNEAEWKVRDMLPANQPIWDMSAKAVAEPVAE